MKNLLLVLCILLYSGTAMATEWTTPEALRAFGKPGDTVNPNARTVNNDQIHNKRISHKNRHARKSRTEPTSLLNSNQPTPAKPELPKLPVK